MLPPLTEKPAQRSFERLAPLSPAWPGAIPRFRNSLAMKPLPCPCTSVQFAFQRKVRQHCYRCYHRAAWVQRTSSGDPGCFCRSRGRCSRQRCSVRFISHSTDVELLSLSPPHPHRHHHHHHLLLLRFMFEVFVSLDLVFGCRASGVCVCVCLG